MLALPCAAVGRAQTPASARAARSSHQRLRHAHLACRPPAPAAPGPLPPLRQPSPAWVQALPGVTEHLDGETRSELPGYLTLAAYAAHALAKRSQLG